MNKKPQTQRLTPIIISIKISQESIYYTFQYITLPNVLEDTNPKLNADRKHLSIKRFENQSRKAL